MKNTVTQNRTLASLTKEDHAQLDLLLSKVHSGIANGKNVIYLCELMYRIVYPRTQAKRRVFTGKQRIVRNAFHLANR